MARQSKYSALTLNLLVAVAIALVVNFSYLLLLLVEQRNDPRPPHVSEQRIDLPDEGRFVLHPDGHGYVVYEAGTIDSVYVSASRIRYFDLADGERLVIVAKPPRTEGGHYTLTNLKRRNGEAFDESTLYNRPARGVELTLQLFYYLLLSFVLLSVLTAHIDRHDYSASVFMRRCAWGLAIAVGLYFFAPVTEWRTGRLMMNFMNRYTFDYILLLKCSFTVVVSILYGYTYMLMSQRQAMAIENEQLKNENLTTRYNMLVSQINPHFFFNSLNSLAMLVREKHDDKALIYIDQLSYTFRYILQNGQSTLMTLDEELKFADAYAYLFKIRYADKLFFDVEVDASRRSWLLPALSLQPLIDNAVKHNTITKSQPLRVSIRTEGDSLVVSNPRIPKLDPEPSTGIGLENLRNRWLLTSGRRVTVEDNGAEFIVRLPLQKPSVSER